MAGKSPGVPGSSPGSGKIQIPVGVIPQCSKWKDCKIADAPMGAMLIEHKGNMYYIGNILCMRCVHLKKVDLFEDITNKLIAKHPDAEEVVGVTPSDLSKMQGQPGSKRH